MRRLTLLAACVGCSAIAVAAGAGIYVYQRPNVLRVAVTSDSDDQATFAALAQELTAAHEQIALNWWQSIRSRKARAPLMTSEWTSRSCAATFPCRWTARLSLSCIGTPWC